MAHGVPAAPVAPALFTSPVHSSGVVPRLLPVTRSSVGAVGSTTVAAGPNAVAAAPAAPPHPPPHPE